jgi:hypothetical protein
MRAPNIAVPQPLLRHLHYALPLQEACQRQLVPVIFASTLFHIFYSMITVISITTTFFNFFLGFFYILSICEEEYVRFGTLQSPNQSVDICAYCLCYNYL